MFSGRFLCAVRAIGNPSATVSCTGSYTALSHANCSVFYTEKFTALEGVKSTEKDNDLANASSSELFNMKDELALRQQS